MKKHAFYCLSFAAAHTKNPMKTTSAMNFIVYPIPLLSVRCLWFRCRQTSYAKNICGHLRQKAFFLTDSAAILREVA